MTNGDNIRQMSDEELAENILCPGIPRCDSKCFNLSPVECKRCKIVWLREEVTEDDTQS